MGRRARQLLLGPLILVAAQVAACGGTSASDNAPAGDGEAARVETIGGTSTVRIELSATAARRLGIETTLVRPAHVGGHDRGARTAIPYAAVLYEPAGKTFTFTSPAPLVFVARPITVERISGSVALLRAGPPVGTRVVVVGSAELLGAEYGVEQG
jgi:hypothetical protein